MRSILMVTVAAAALAMGATGSFAADKLKVGFVYVGPHNDGGFSERHDIGRQDVEKAFGDKVETNYVESVAEGPDAERVIERLARQGDKLIFTTSFGFMDATLNTAKRFPNVKFEHATGFKTAKNMGVYNARFYEGRYVAGVIAGKMTKTNVIGYLGSFPIPEVVQGIDAFTMGARSVNPNVKTKVVWVNTWFDPGKEADGAKALFDQGIDVLMQHTDSPAPLQVAAQRGGFGFGEANDMIKFAPKNQLSAVIDNWGPYYVKATQSVLDGTWKSEAVWGGFDSGMVQMAPFTNMPDDVAKVAQETVDKIKSHQLNPFAGPIKKQDGSVAVAEGQTLSDKDLTGLNWYVEGVEGDLPK
ncbi:nucleoside-binding protein [Faunimonas pinastri]|uniref:Nucleoside-binding protein n=1 Tax=Faunimonas pinastri TaxID=1855383 RepID=A0A1H9LAV7_9HYPH|nr:BMP family ABC transporter substrate-binding protein [Faunimonas pinastri]SER08275.1 nucleoside-binding protein [Faunimonas pinastri]